MVREGKMVRKKSCSSSGGCQCFCKMAIHQLCRYFSLKSSNRLIDLAFCLSFSLDFSHYGYLDRRHCYILCWPVCTRGTGALHNRPVCVVEGGPGCEQYFNRPDSHTLQTHFGLLLPISPTLVQQRAAERHTPRPAPYITPDSPPAGQPDFFYLFV